MVFMDILNGDIGPRRGDLVHTNVGDRRERTWLVLRSRQVRRKDRSKPMRFELWMARWWELEPEMRMRLHASAERRGGQFQFWLKRYPPKKKQTFEQFMQRNQNSQDTP